MNWVHGLFEGKLDDDDFRLMKLYSSEARAHRELSNYGRFVVHEDKLDGFYAVSLDNEVYVYPIRLED